VTHANRSHLPAIEGGDPIREEFLPFFRPSISEGDVESVTEALKSGWLTLGPQTEKFEQELKSYIGAQNVVAVNSCSAAMFLALKALGVGPGDEVITSALTFASTVHGIIHAGARPVLADIEPETFGPAPAEFERLTTSRTKVYLPVHFGGQACRIDEICTIAKAKGVHVIEDAAHSFGASVDGRMVGTIGDATAFSFYATKNLTCGEGGALSTDNDDISSTTRSLVYHGMSHDSWARYSEKGSWYYEVDYPGYKYNMSDILSSLGRSQLRRTATLLASRRAVAEQFITRLADSRYFELPMEREGNLHTWHLFVVRLNSENLTIDRDRFVRALAAENIGYSVHFIPIYKHPFFEPYLEPNSRYPECDDYFDRCISLPIFPDMREEDVEDVVGALNRIATYYAKT
jgi:dTDP-4-amino-4,6-dideoxygalactose transaminase